MSISLNWTISPENLKELAEFLEHKSDDDDRYFYLYQLKEFFELKIQKQSRVLQKVSFYDMDS